MGIRLKELEKHLMKYGDGNDVVLQWFAESKGFRTCQWEFMSAPRHPILEVIIKGITDCILNEGNLCWGRTQEEVEINKQGKDIQDMTRFVTGPEAFMKGVNSGILNHGLVMDRDYAVYGAHFK